jgi:hypothetical protein
MNSSIILKFYLEIWNVGRMPNRPSMSETNQTSFKNIMNFLFSFKLKNLTIDKY